MMDLSVFAARCERCGVTYYFRLGDDSTYFCSDCRDMLRRKVRRGRAGFAFGLMGVTLLVLSLICLLWFFFTTWRS